MSHSSSPGSATSRRERRKQEVRGRITEAAISLFSERGCEATTVEEICELADVARKTFYNYFPSKQQLVHELSESLLFGETQNLVELAMERHERTDQRIAFFVRHMSSNVARFERLEKALIHQTMLDLSSDEGRAGAQLERLNRAFIQLYSAGRKQGDINRAYSVEFLAEMTVGAINAVMLNWVHNDRYPVAARVKDLSRWLQQMVAPTDR